MKIALVHDYLNEAGGAERVLRVLADMYPTAPIYTTFAKNGTAKAMFANRQVVESKWGWLLKIGRLYSYLRFLLPWIWKSIDLREYDLVITSCSGYIARGFKVSQTTKVIAYCHTPPRWLYGYDTPTGAQAKWWGQMFMWIVGPFVRYFDYQSAQRVDTWIANSEEVAKRIEKFYRKKAVVVYPPIEFSNPKFSNSQMKRDYYLVVSRIVGGKGIEKAIEGAKKAGVKLKVVGEIVNGRWPMVNDRKIEYLGRVDDRELARLYVGARGFVALARDEDFGMTVVESMVQGTPVLAYNGGGYRETVVPGKTGILINGIDVKWVTEGIIQMERTKWNRTAIKKWASKFGRARFEKKIRETIKPLNH
ncbi:MAG: glycosyltransferase [bacterium]